MRAEGQRDEGGGGGERRLEDWPMRRESVQYKRFKSA